MVNGHTLHNSYLLLYIACCLQAGCAHRILKVIANMVLETMIFTGNTTKCYHVKTHFCLSSFQ